MSFGPGPSDFLMMLFGSLVPAEITTEWCTIDQILQTTLERRPNRPTPLQVTGKRNSDQAFVWSSLHRTDRRVWCGGRGTRRGYARAAELQSCTNDSPKEYPGAFFLVMSCAVDPVNQRRKAGARRCVSDGVVSFGQQPPCPVATCGPVGGRGRRSNREWVTYRQTMAAGTVLGPGPAPLPRSSDEPWFVLCSL